MSTPFTIRGCGSGNVGADARRREHGGQRIRSAAVTAAVAADGSGRGASDISSRAQRAMRSGKGSAVFLKPRQRVRGLRCVAHAHDSHDQRRTAAPVEIIDPPRNASAADVGTVEIGNQDRLSVGADVLSRTFRSARSTVIVAARSAAIVQVTASARAAQRAVASWDEQRERYDHRPPASRPRQEKRRDRPPSFVSFEAAVSACTRRPWPRAGAVTPNGSTCNRRSWGRRSRDRQATRDVPRAVRPSHERRGQAEARQPALACRAGCDDRARLVRRRGGTREQTRAPRCEAERGRRREDRHGEPAATPDTCHSVTRLRSGANASVSAALAQLRVPTLTRARMRAMPA